MSSNGVATDPSKISTIQEWPIPTILKQLRGCLGLVGYYGRFIRDFTQLSYPLYSLLKKLVEFQWNSATQQSFNSLKSALMPTPMLALSDFNQNLIIKTNSSMQGIGAILLERSPNIAYISRMLLVKYQSLTIYEKQMFAILFAILFAVYEKKIFAILFVLKMGVVPNGEPFCYQD